jgi:penicillin V acylase-like amidase (Ntn superfamily)
MDLRGLVDLASCPGGFLREQKRGFHDLLRQNPTSIHILGMDLGHRIQLQNTPILATKSRSMDRIIREAIELNSIPTI